MGKSRHTGQIQAQVRRSGMGFVAFDHGGCLGGAQNIAGNILFAGKLQIIVGIQFGGLLIDGVDHLAANRFFRRAFLNAEHQNDQGTRTHRNTHRFSDEADMLHLRYDQPQGLGRTGGCQDDIV